MRWHHERLAVLRAAPHAPAVAGLASRTAGLREYGRKSVEYCERKGVDIASLAIRFCVENPDLTTTVAGTANPANMANILKWVEEPLDRQLLAAVQEILEPVKNVL